MDTDWSRTLETLARLPTFTSSERLYVGTDGRLHLDRVYDRLGSFGRTLLDRVVGGYSRTATMACLESLVSEELQPMVQRIVRDLTPPFLVTRHGTEEVLSSETRQHSDHVPEILGGVQTLLSFLAEVGLVYPEFQTRLDRLQEIVGELRTALESVGVRSRG